MGPLESQFTYRTLPVHRACRKMRASKRPYMRLAAVAQATYCTNTYRQGTRDTAAIHAIALGQVLQRAMSCHRAGEASAPCLAPAPLLLFHLSTLEQEVTLPHPR